MLLNCHIGCIVLGLLCAGIRVRVGWGDIRAAGFLDTQHVSGINMSIFRSLRLCC